MFEKAGFKDISIEALSGFFVTSILKMNYFSARFIKGPKPLRWLILYLLVPIWTICQFLAPYLDKFDKNWDAEAVGYIVLAWKR
ncbi:MAG: hypothetical protein PHE97_05495 [Candidatus Omnitrophica bacterium]|nr:hypothetical protein [Candidatus Omnitrophota bacterium]